MTDTYENGYAESRARFERETAEHEMTILHDDGLYRHLRFQKPGTSFYYYDLITWPGRLVVCGDCGDYMFSRLRDMFEFFEGSTINPHYWGEKLQGPRPGRDGAKSYSEDRFKVCVLEWLEDTVVDLSVDAEKALREAVQRDVLDDDDGYLADESMARLRLHDFDHGGHYFTDTFEWDLREWDWSYLWCCWAIVRGIQQFRAVAVTEAVAA